MNGLDLLNRLQELQTQGVDLSAHTVSCGYNSVDPSIPYDCGIEERTWPDDIRVDDETNELFIR